MGRLVEVKFQVSKLILGKTQWDEKDCNLTTNLAAKCVAHPKEIARIVNLQKQNLPLFIVIQCPQAEFDMDTFNIEVGRPEGAQLPLENGARIAANQAAIAEKEQDQAGKAEALAEVAEIDQDAGKLDDPVAEVPHNGHSTPKALAETVSSESFLDLSTFDFRPANGKAIPAAFFLLGERVECSDGELKKGLLELFAKWQINCQTPEELVAVLQKYPESDSKAAIIEILRDQSYINKDADAMFDSMGSAGEEYRQEKVEAGTGESEDKPKRRRRKNSL